MLAIFSNTPRSRKRRIAGTSSARAKHEFFFFAVCALPVQKKAVGGLPRKIFAQDETASSCKFVQILALHAPHRLGEKDRGHAATRRGNVNPRLGLARER